MKTLLHEVTGKNRYCGPTAMATVLGISTDHAAAIARRVSGKTAIRGLSTFHLKMSLEAMGCSVARRDYPKGEQPTVTQWLKENASQAKDKHIILVHGHHFGTLLGRRYLCSLTKKQAVPFADIPKRRARVTGYLAIITLPETAPVPDLAAKLAIPEAASKRKALTLATRWGIDVTREDPQATIWVYPPSDMLDADDPHSDENSGEGHYVDDWHEALTRVEELVTAIKKTKGTS